MVNTLLQYVALLPLFHAVNILTPEGSQYKNRASNPYNTFYVIGKVWQKKRFFF